MRGTRAAREIHMFNDKIDYSNPEYLPYSKASAKEILYSWLFALLFIGLVLVLFAFLS